MWEDKIMSAYDVFLKNTHSDKIARMMIRNNIRLIRYLAEKYFKNKRNLKVLEVGPGKGYFKKAVQIFSGGGISIMRLIKMKIYCEI